MRRRLISSLFVLAAALAITACGKKEEVVHHGETEGIYLTLGPLAYQVQISRLLNPNDAEDRGFLVGLDPQDNRLKPEDQWFAVFIRVQNTGDEPAPSAREFEIRDTQETVFRPVRFAADNVFAYRPATIPGKGLLPVPDSPPAETTIQGAMLLYKIPNANLENRPLELHIRAPEGAEEATVALDV